MTFDIDYTLDQLTNEEKILLLCGMDNWHTYPVPRLDVPRVRFTDGPNGVRGTKAFNGLSAACFPSGTGLAATFNQQLLTKAGALMALEAKHKGAHCILGPTTNMERGPLGGRSFECLSEDPYLAGMISSAIINGMQTNSGPKAAATIKHFVCNDLEHERKASDSIVTERALREVYLEPFRLAVKHSNPVCFMTSYTKVNGDRASQSKKLLKDILQEEWGWRGMIMSDWHGLYTAKTALQNGLDLEMPGPTYYRQLKSIKHMVDSRELPIEDLNDRARNVLRLVKFAKESGIPFEAIEDDLNNTEATSKSLREIAAEAVVLLKNEDNVLPLKPEEKVAIIGPNAKVCTFSGGGSAFLRPYYTTTPYDCIAAKLNTPPEYTLGCYGHKNLPSLATQLINPSTGKVGYSMKFYQKPAGEPDRQQFDELNLDQFYIFLQDYRHPSIKDDLYYIDIEGYFVPPETATYRFGCTVLGTALLFVDDTLVVDNKNQQKKGTSFFNSGSAEKSNTIDLQKGKQYKVRLEFGSRPTFSVPDANVVDFGGGGGINFGCTKEIEGKEEIQNAVALAKSVDKVVLSIGLSHEWESEGSDRPNLDLPLLTNDLVEAVIAANPNTVIVNQSGGPVEFPWINRAKCLVHAWYGGNETGNGIADVLFGDHNPSGRLSVTFPMKVSDNPTFLNFRTDRGRVLYGEDIFIGYRYYEKLQKQVCFPFGYGLSYTQFEYSKLSVKVGEESNSLGVNLAVKNTGDYDGHEVVQVYISHKDAQTTKPVKELKGFEKVFIKKGETVNVKFEMSLKDSTSFYDEYFNKWNMEKGVYGVLVGRSSDDIEMMEEFSIEKGKLWVGL